MAKKLIRYTDLEVYAKAFDLAMQIFELSKSFPREETYSLTDQVRCSSRNENPHVSLSPCLLVLL